MKTVPRARHQNPPHVEGEAPGVTASVRTCDHGEAGQALRARRSCYLLSPAIQWTNPMVRKAKTKVRTTRCGKRGAAKSHRGGQGYHPVDPMVEIEAVREGWSKKGDPIR